MHKIFTKFRVSVWLSPSPICPNAEVTFEAGGLCAAILFAPLIIPSLFRSPAAAHWRSVEWNGNPHQSIARGTHEWQWQKVHQQEQEHGPDQEEEKEGIGATEAKAAPIALPLPRVDHKTCARLRKPSQANTSQAKKENTANESRQKQSRLGCNTYTVIKFTKLGNLNILTRCPTIRFYKKLSE